jgi:plastocyanin
MPDFSIRILKTDEGVKFDPLSAPPTACITWNNTTPDTHQITYETFSSDPILAGMSSRPGYVIDAAATGTLTYYCTLHDDESGTIDVEQAVPMPTEPC